jgi:hypothetical protein
MQVHDTNIYIPPEWQILTFAQLPSAPNAGISLVITAGKLIDTQCPVSRLSRAKGLFGFNLLKFNSDHINVPLNVWSTKCRLIACMSAQIRSNLRDEYIKPN